MPAAQIPYALDQIDYSCTNWLTVRMLCTSVSSSQRIIRLASNQLQSSIRQTRLATMTATAGPSSTEQQQTYSFGPWPISPEEVFAKTQLSYAFVNLKPIVPGHVLISPIRVVKRFAELSAEEVSDLWGLAQLVGKTLEPHYKASSLTLAIQDGPAAGQTVPHVHIHVLPRRPGDFQKNDEVYDELDKAEAHLPKLSERLQGEGEGSGKADKLDLDKERVVRTRNEMAAEAAELRKLFS